VRDENAANFLKGAVEKITQHRPVLHALERTRNLRSLTTDLYFHGDKSVQSIL
jgi:hypothetical protein